MGIALLVPFTFGMNPITGIVMLLGIYTGAIYGGGIASILIKTPGTPAAAATVAAFEGSNAALMIVQARQVLGAATGNGNGQAIEALRYADEASSISSKCRE
jgi:TctA family transporter